MRGHFPKRLILMSFLVISTCLAGCEKKNAIEKNYNKISYFYYSNYTTKY